MLARACCEDRRTPVCCGGVGRERHVRRIAPNLERQCGLHGRCFGCVVSVNSPLNGTCSDCTVYCCMHMVLLHVLAASGLGHKQVAVAVAGVSVGMLDRKTCRVLD